MGGTEADKLGMLGDGTEEQNLDQLGDRQARITEDEVAEYVQRENARQPRSRREHLDLRQAFPKRLGS